MIGEEVSPHISNIRFENLSSIGSLSIINFLKPSKQKDNRIHDFSLIFSKYDHCVVVGCLDYPLCQDTITIFSKRE
jgi:hypothetical protein